VENPLYEPETIGIYLPASELLIGKSEPVRFLQAKKSPVKGEKTGVKMP
jgi:hypothetical protein